MFMFLNPTNSSTAPICFLSFMLIGVLVGSMYYSGRNPLGMFDITSPKLPKLITKRPMVGGMSLKLDQSFEIRKAKAALKAATKISALTLAAAAASINNIATTSRKGGASSGILRRYRDSIMNSKMSMAYKILALKKLASLGASGTNRATTLKFIKSMLSGQMNGKFGDEDIATMLKKTSVNSSKKRNIKDDFDIMEKSFYDTAGKSKTLDKLYGAYSRDGMLGRIPLIGYMVGSVKFAIKTPGLFGKMLGYKGKPKSVSDYDKNKYEKKLMSEGVDADVAKYLAGIKSETQKEAISNIRNDDKDMGHKYKATVDNVYHMLLVKLFEKMYDKGKTNDKEINEQLRIILMSNEHDARSRFAQILRIARRKGMNMTELKELLEIATAISKIESGDEFNLLSKMRALNNLINDDNYRKILNPTSILFQDDIEYANVNAIRDVIEKQYVYMVLMENLIRGEKVDHGSITKEISKQLSGIINGHTKKVINLFTGEHSERDEMVGGLLQYVRDEKLLSKDALKKANSFGLETSEMQKILNSKEKKGMALSKELISLHNKLDKTTDVKEQIKIQRQINKKEIERLKLNFVLSNEDAYHDKFGKLQLKLTIDQTVSQLEKTIIELKESNPKDKDKNIVERIKHLSTMLSDYKTLFASMPLFGIVDDIKDTKKLLSLSLADGDKSKMTELKSRLKRLQQLKREEGVVDKIYCQDKLAIHIDKLKVEIASKKYSNNKNSVQKNELLKSIKKLETYQDKLNKSKSFNVIEYESNTRLGVIVKAISLDSKYYVETLNMNKRFLEEKRDKNKSDSKAYEMIDSQIKSFDNKYFNKKSDNYGKYSGNVSFGDGTPIKNTLQMYMDIKNKEFMPLIKGTKEFDKRVADLFKNRIAKIMQDDGAYNHHIAHLGHRLVEYEGWRKVMKDHFGEDKTGEFLKRRDELVKKMGLDVESAESIKLKKEIETIKNKLKKYDEEQLKLVNNFDYEIYTDKDQGGETLSKGKFSTKRELELMKMDERVKQLNTIMSDLNIKLKQMSDQYDKIKTPIFFKEQQQVRDEIAKLKVLREGLVNEVSGAHEGYMLSDKGKGLDSKKMAELDKKSNLAFEHAERIKFLENRLKWYAPESVRNILIREFGLDKNFSDDDLKRNYNNRLKTNWTEADLNKKSVWVKDANGKYVPYFKELSAGDLEGVYGGVVMMRALDTYNAMGKETPLDPSGDYVAQSIYNGKFGGQFRVFTTAKQQDELLKGMTATQKVAWLRDNYDSQGQRRNDIEILRVKSNSMTLKQLTKYISQNCDYTTMNQNPESIAKKVMGIKKDNYGGLVNADGKALLSIKSRIELPDHLFVTADKAMRGKGGEWSKFGNKKWLKEQESSGRFTEVLTNKEYDEKHGGQRISEILSSLPIIGQMVWNKQSNTWRNWVTPFAKLDNLQYSDKDVFKSRNNPALKLIGLLNGNYNSSTGDWKDTTGNTGIAKIASFLPILDRKIDNFQHRVARVIQDEKKPWGEYKRAAIASGVYSQMFNTTLQLHLAKKALEADGGKTLQMQEVNNKIKNTQIELDDQRLELTEQKNKLSNPTHKEDNLVKKSKHIIDKYEEQLLVYNEKIMTLMVSKGTREEIKIIKQLKTKLTTDYHDEMNNLKVDIDVERDLRDQRIIEVETKFNNNKLKLMAQMNIYNREYREAETLYTEAKSELGQSIMEGAYSNQIIHSNFNKNLGLIKETMGGDSKAFHDLEKSMIKMDNISKANWELDNWVASKSMPDNLTMKKDSHYPDTLGNKALGWMSLQHPSLMFQSIGLSPKAAQIASVMTGITPMWAAGMAMWTVLKPAKVTASWSGTNRGRYDAEVGGPRTWEGFLYNLKIIPSLMAKTVETITPNKFAKSPAFQKVLGLAAPYKSYEQSFQTGRQVYTGQIVNEMNRHEYQGWDVEKLERGRYTYKDAQNRRHFMPNVAQKLVNDPLFVNTMPELMNDVYKETYKRDHYAQGSNIGATLSVFGRFAKDEGLARYGDGISYSDTALSFNPFSAPFRVGKSVVNQVTNLAQTIKGEKSKSQTGWQTAKNISSSLYGNVNIFGTNIKDEVKKIKGQLQYNCPNCGGGLYISQGVRKCAMCSYTYTNKTIKDTITDKDYYNRLADDMITDYSLIPHDRSIYRKHLQKQGKLDGMDYDEERK